MLLFLDFESYWDHTVTLRKLTPPEYIFHPKFHVHGCSFKRGLFGTAQWFDAPKLPALFASLDPADTALCAYNMLFDGCVAAWVYGFTPALMIDAMGMARATYGHKFRSFSLANVSRELGLGTKGDEVQNTRGMTTEELRAGPLFWAKFKAYCNNDTDLCAGVFAKVRPTFPAEQFVWMDLVLRCAIEPQLTLNRRTCVMHRHAARRKKWDMLRACGSDKPDLMSAPKFKALLESLGVVVELKDSPTDVRKGKLPSYQYRRELLEQVVGHEQREKVFALWEKPGTKGEGEAAAAALVRLGVKFPNSADYCRQIPAIAKTDLFMAQLQEHPNEHVAALATARLGVRSTQGETRAKRFAALARLPAHYADHGTVLRVLDGYRMPVSRLTYPAAAAPIALRYGAAHTHRLGGEWKLNFQNLVRGGALRAAIEAPPGYALLAPDYSQIEARFVAWLARQRNLIEMFAKNLDPYSQLASRIFGYKVERKKRDAAGKLMFEVEGFVGKKGILGLGYNAGADKLHWMVHNDARNELGRDIEFSIADAIRVVNVYRREMFPDIPRLWYLLENLINDLRNPTPMPGWKERFPFLNFEHEAVVLPSGMRLTYYNLENTGEGFTYNYGNELRSIYGGKMLENWCQALAGIVVQEAAVRLWRKHKLRFALQSHDELVFLCRVVDTERVRRLIDEEMAVVPQWAPGLPVAVEIKTGTSYGNVK